MGVSQNTTQACNNRQGGQLSGIQRDSFAMVIYIWEWGGGQNGRLFFGEGIKKHLASGDVHLEALEGASISNCSLQGALDPPLGRCNEKTCRILNGNTGRLYSHRLTR